MGGTSITNTAYDFVSNVTKLQEKHGTNTLEYGYTYDDRSRLLNVTASLNGATPITLKSLEYDEVGRLKKVKLHNNTTSSEYDYNIRSWLTGISGNKFSQSLTYGSYNGNITAMSWNANGSNHGYTFAYDGANRLTDAVHGLGNYTEKVTSYDKNGNILGLQRYGQTGASSYGLVDNLTYTLDGNQITKVEDAVSTSSYNGGTNFINGASTENEYTYDYNGNLTKDSNKGIADISWNSLNLPSVVTFADGSIVTYTYAADGTKLRTVHYINGTTTQTDYTGSVLYENGMPKSWMTESGYISMDDSKYHYYLQDHQGNNRVVISETGAVEEVNHYYAFGGLFSSDESVQPFKYNGKELDTKKGLNWYDYGARQYDATLGRWFVVDPLAEKYQNISPYTFSGNYGFNVREVNGGLFIFINGFNWQDASSHLFSEFGKAKTDRFYIPKSYSPSRDFGYENTYDWKGIDNLYKKTFNDYKAFYINGSFPLHSNAEERYNRGIESGMELIQKLRSGEYTLGEGETIKIVGYSMGGAYAAGMAYALMQDPEYAKLLQLVDYLAPYQPKDFSHPNGVTGRQFVSSNDWIATNFQIENVTLEKEDFSKIGHFLDKDFYNFIKNCFNNGVPITIIH